MTDTPILKQASDAIKPHEPKALEAFAKVFKRKRPPQSMRALAPLAMVLFLEAFGLAFLLDRATVRAAVLAARGPGKGEDDDLLDDSDDMAAIRWAAARQDALDRAYRAFARELFEDAPMGCATLAKYIKSGYGPNRVEFERVWGERNPIDPATAPRCFDPRAKLSILDAVSTERDGLLGVFVSDISLRGEIPPIVECMGQTLDLGACETLDAAAWRAVSNGWIAYIDHRGAVMGLRLIPRTDGIATRLRAPLVNIVSMYQEDKRDEWIRQLESDKENLAESNRVYCEQNLRLSNELQAIRREWQDATGASDPEMARELTAQRIEQIRNCEAIIKEAEDILNDSELPPGLLVDRIEIAVKAYKPKRADGLGAFVGRELAGGEEGVGRMVWPDPDNSPDVIKCANAIVAHRRGEFVELTFPSTPQIFEQVRAWLMFYQMNICARTPDATGYCTNAIGLNGEIPPKWADMKQAKRNSYPGFVLFAPDNSAKVVFCAKEPSIGKVGKRKAREPKS